ncbi:hypothetical protein D3C85_474650 [compost metagenome]
MKLPYTLYIDDYTFEIDVTHLHHQPPMGKWVDSSDDARGYTDIEFNVVSAVHADKEKVDEWEIEEYLYFIEKRLLEQLLGEEDYAEY